LQPRWQAIGEPLWEWSADCSQSIEKTKECGGDGGIRTLDTSNPGMTV
jgi:hypothetical protein